MDDFVEPMPTDSNKNENDLGDSVGKLAANTLSKIEPYTPPTESIAPSIPGQPLNSPENLRGNNSNATSNEVKTNVKSSFSMMKILIVFGIIMIALLGVYYVLGSSNNEGPAAQNDQIDSNQNNGTSENVDNSTNDTDNNTENIINDNTDENTDQNEEDVPVENIIDSTTVEIKSDVNGEIINPKANEVINGEFSILGRLDSETDLLIEVYDFYNNLLVSKNITNITTSDLDILFEENINLKIAPSEKIGIIKLYDVSNGKALIDSNPIKFTVSKSNNSTLEILSPQPNQKIDNDTFLLTGELDKTKPAQYRITIDNDSSEQIFSLDIDLNLRSNKDGEFNELIDISEITDTSGEIIMEIYEIDTVKGSISIPVRIPLSLSESNSQTQPSRGGRNSLDQDQIDETNLELNSETGIVTDLL
ncbi:MAG: hypothetical protein Q9M91_01760 [Candidatus Dojkabacteria bacterium]|nr:hypothetical protein [Candidatus Dojkabacteria bacterium]MDQ7020550.1 hypothetical protein [Candidatus Dojkabacteria bacterium]